MKRKTILLVLTMCSIFAARLYSQTLSDLQKLAFSGNLAAQFHLGKNYYTGTNGYSKDPGLAAYWFLSAAQKGYADAQSFAATCYLTANGVPENGEKGKYWAELAVNQNNEWGYYELGLYYLHYAKNIPEAVFWIQKYYEISKNEFVKKQLTELALDGYCKPPVEDFSLNLINMAQSGLPEACYKLGNAYLNGYFGLEKNTDKVYPLIKQAVEKGFSQALPLAAYWEYMAAENQQDKDSATAKMNDAINRFIPEAYCFMASIAEKENRFDDAAKWYRYFYVILNEPGSKEFVDNLAAKGYTFSIPDPTNTAYNFQPDVCVYIGNELIKKQQYSEAVEYFDRALTKEPNNFFATNDRGVCYFNMGNLSKAKVDFKRAVEIEPNNQLAKNNLQLVQQARTTRTLNVIGAIAVGLSNAANAYVNSQQHPSTPTSPGSTTTKSPTTTLPAQKCSLCEGTGEVVAYSVSYVGGLVYCKKCGKDVPEGHYHNTCPSCRGKGYR